MWAQVMSERRRVTVNPKTIVEKPPDEADLEKIEMCKENLENLKKL